MTFRFDADLDIFTIQEGFAPDESFTGNAVLGDIILDVSTLGAVRGIEILNATEFFKDFGVSRRVLGRLSDARFTATVRPDSLLLSVFVTSDLSGGELPAKVHIPLVEAVV